MHKGNIMKFTEGAFREWGYEVARRGAFPKFTVTEEDVKKKHNGVAPKGKVVIKDRIADAMFQQVLLRPEEYDVIATPNLNGDYISMPAPPRWAVWVWHLGQILVIKLPSLKPPWYCTQICGKGYGESGSVILSGVMMFEHLGWDEAADMIVKALEKLFRRRLSRTILNVR